jgi:hypothetical protein
VALGRPYAIGGVEERTEGKRDGSRLGPRLEGVDARSELGLYAARPPCEAFRTMALEEGWKLSVGCGLVRLSPDGNRIALQINEGPSVGDVWTYDILETPSGD